METYKSQPHRIASNIDTVYSRLSQPSLLGDQIATVRDRMPQEALDNLDKMRFEADAIVIDSPMGEMRLAIDAEQSIAPTKLVYTTAQAPVRFDIAILLTAVDEQSTESTAVLSVDLPLFLRAMVGKQLQQAADKFGESLAMLPYDTTGSATT